LQDILKKFPNSIVIIDHFARSVFDDGAPYQKASDLWGLAKFSGVHLKLTHRTLEAALVGNSNHEDFFRHVLRFFSADRIAWGSNFPCCRAAFKHPFGRGSGGDLSSRSKRSGFDPWRSSKITVSVPAIT
jgi:predicted TIM-barrel fold metal-dependent hydrolase